MSLPNHWGSLGGKINEGEIPQNALVLEIKEEVRENITVQV